jgi:DNA-binding MarR family transcriptional regulator
MSHLDGRPANLLGALAVGIDDAVRAALTDGADLDVTAVAALLVIRRQPGQSITDLAAALGITHSGAVRTVDRLFDRGLAERGTGRDGRSRGLLLTDHGLRRTDDALEARRTVLDGLLAGLPARRRAGFVAGLEDLLAQLPGTRHDAWRICRTCEHEICRGAHCPVGAAVDAAETAGTTTRPPSRGDA